MKMVSTLVLVAAALPWLVPGEARAGDLVDELVVEHEAGFLRVFQNDGRYGPEGSMFTAGDVGQQRNLLLSSRTAVEWAFADRHRLVFLYAPLDVTTVVALDDDLQFRDTFFPAGTLVSHRYLFDGYRMSYLNRLVNSDKLEISAGASIQIRNAEVSFTELNGRRFETENDIGLVFAVKSRVVYRPWDDGLYAMLEGDGFSTFGLLGDSVRGAIYDVALSLGVPVADGADLFFRARWLGGGAVVESRDIDNWANLGALTAGVRLNLPVLLD